MTFSKRCAKELLRDPLNIAFGLGFPVVLLLLMSAIQANVPVDIFRIESLSGGVAVFGLSFLTLFSATLISRDRESSFLERLYTTPMKPRDFIFGYMMPLIPISMIQSTITYAVSFMLGLPISVNICYAIVALLPVSVLYISLGLLFGSILNVKQVGGICGALLTNVSAWLSGVWFDLQLVGGAFKNISYMLPFVHAVELERSAVSGNFNNFLQHMLIVVAYALVITFVSILLFLRQMKKR